MLALALVSPLHPLGEALFSAHMVQHEILMLVAAPLLVLSRPLVTFLWGMPFEWRRGAGRWAKAGYVRRSWAYLTDPFTAWWISCRRDLDLACSLHVRVDSRERACPHGAAFELLPVRLAVLVGLVLRPWPERLRCRGVLRVHNCRVYQHSWSTAHLLSARLVCRI